MNVALPVELFTAPVPMVTPLFLKVTVPVTDPPKCEKTVAVKVMAEPTGTGHPPSGAVRSGRERTAAREGQQALF